MSNEQSYLSAEIAPIIDGDCLYYKTIVYDVEIGKNAVRSVRDVFHSDTFEIAVASLSAVYSATAD